MAKVERLKTLEKLERLEQLEKLENEIYDLQNKITNLNVEYEELHYRMEDAIDSANEANNEIERVRVKIKNNEDAYHFVTGNYQYVKGKIDGLKEVVNENNRTQRSE
jgi:chromosome segregation ATPase